VVNLAVLACVLRATTKKVKNFLREKRVHPEKILATPMFFTRARLHKCVWDCTKVKVKVKVNVDLYSASS